ncbi:MAG: conjugal transfer protein TraN, partial [Dictyoglomus turgidum]
SYLGSLTINSNGSISGCVAMDIDVVAFEIYGSGNQIHFVKWYLRDYHRQGDLSSYLGSLTINSNGSISGCVVMDNYLVAYEIYGSGNQIHFVRWTNSYTSYLGSLTINTSYFCPLGGSYNPQTGKCEIEATCPTGTTLTSDGCLTGYGCPLGNYQCQQVNNQWMCSPYQCITQKDLVDEGDVIASGLEDDGPRDDQGNCLGELYIFNGKGMRCRKSGIQTGFHNCCNESRGKLTDSTGSTGGTLSHMIDVIKAIAAVKQAVQFGYMLYKLTQGGYAVISKIGNVVEVLNISAGKVIASYSALSAEGKALLDVAKQYYTNAGYIPDTGISYSLTGADADKVVSTGISDYIQNLGPQMAVTIVQLGVSQIVKDPVLSSAINLVITSLAVAANILPPIGIALQVVQLFLSLFMARCDQQDILTSTLNESKYCHEVGEYCVKKWPLVGCVQKARGFCCFNSKLARIVHEQGRPQLQAFAPNGAWGDPKNPNCRGFRPEEFQALDFNKIDLSEYIEDIQKNIRQNLEPQMKEQIQKEWGQ